MTVCAARCRILAAALVAGAAATAVAYAPAHGFTIGGPMICDASVLASAAGERVTIREAAAVPAGDFMAPGARSPLKALPAFCRLRASVAPGIDSYITFEVWIPHGWNGKLVATGNGGYSNALSYRDMAWALSQGYAAIGGDTGHQAATPDDLLWGAGHPEKILDWGTRSIHAIVAPGRRLVELAARAPVRRAYFYGCSTGGHQGFAEMQRFARDFDGVVAGAPGHNRVRLNAGFLWQFLANHRPGEAAPILPASKLPLVTKAAIAACDAADGVADGVVDDPRTCAFDPSVLQCTGDDRGDCLTRDEIAALNRMYAGARNPRTGEQIYAGWPRTSEALTVLPDGSPGIGWQQYWGAAEPARANFWRYWVFGDPQWNWWRFDFDRDVAAAIEGVGRLIDQVDPDLAAFKARGGKAIVYQGWQDPVVNAIDTVAYYERVRTRQGSQRETDRFLRLFMVPGMGHCAGGTGATSFGNQGAPPPVVDADHDVLSALDRWVERGKAPDLIVASRVVGGRVVRTRPLCRYPARAVYAGHGPTDDAASFACR